MTLLLRITYRGVTLRSDHDETLDRYPVTCETCGRYIADADDIDTLTAAGNAHLDRYHPGTQHPA